MKHIRRLGQFPANPAQTDGRPGAVIPTGILGVGHAVGLDALKASSDYIQIYRGELETLAQSLERIQQTSTLILSALDPE